MCVTVTRERDTPHSRTRAARHDTVASSIISAAAAARQEEAAAVLFAHAREYIVCVRECVR